jgi:hypothetical protein
MEVVVPLRLQAVSATLALADEPWVIAVALGDDPELAAEFRRELVDAHCDRFEDVQW